MRLLFYFLLTISVIAQDSTKISVVLDNTQKLSLLEKDIEKTIFPKSIVEMKVNRSWKRNIELNNDKLSNKATLIKYVKREPNFIDTDLFLVLVGSAVALGATAAYFKLESDVSYDKYMTTNDKSYLNKVDDYDLYSGLALGALEINFGFLIYKFLSD